MPLVPPASATYVKCMRGWPSPNGDGGMKTNNYCPPLYTKKFKSLPDIISGLIT